MRVGKFSEVALEGTLVQNLNPPLLFLLGKKKITTPTAVSFKWMLEGEGGSKAILSPRRNGCINKEGGLQPPYPSCSSIIF